MNYISHIVGFLIAVLLMFIIPAFRMFWIVDHAILKHVNYETQLFVNTVRHKGYVSKELYENFVRNLAKTMNVYDIEMVHVRKAYVPGNTGEVVVYDDCYPTYYILNAIYNQNQDYKMKIGDEFVVSVVNKTKTGTMVFLDFLGGENIPLIFTRYGGMITNEDY